MIYGECVGCQRMAFKPLPCAICYEKDRSSAFCETCRSESGRTCECGEYLCDNHQQAPYHYHIEDRPQLPADGPEIAAFDRAIRQ